MNPLRSPSTVKLLPPPRLGPRPILPPGSRLPLRTERYPVTPPPGTVPQALTSSHTLEVTDTQTRTPGPDGETVSIVRTVKETVRAEVTFVAAPPPLPRPALPAYRSFNFATGLETVRWFCEMAKAEPHPEDSWSQAYAVKLEGVGFNLHKAAWLRIQGFGYTFEQSVKRFCQVRRMSVRTGNRRDLPDVGEFLQTLTATDAWLGAQTIDRKPTVKELIEITSFEFGYGSAMSSYVLLSLQNAMTDAQRGEFFALTHGYRPRRDAGRP